MARLKAIAKGALALFALGLGSFAALNVFLPTYAASFVVVSEIEISDVGLSLERQPVTRATRHRPLDHLFAWDTTVARGTRPDPVVEITWRGPDGRQRLVRERVHHDNDAPRCIHVLRLDSAADPVAVGEHFTGAARLIDSRCR
jgi:hypothetical protein